MPELSKVVEQDSKVGINKDKVVEATVVSDVPSSDGKKVKYSRPPIEQITSDLVDYITSLSINDKPVERLGFSCGKMIYGVRDGDKEIRVLAFKARKKSLSVENNSRAVFFFGIVSPNETIKRMNGLPVSTSTRGACSCQVKEPTFLTLDKMTFTENFNKDVGAVMIALKSLALQAVEQRINQIEEASPEVEVTD